MMRAGTLLAVAAAAVLAACDGSDQAEIQQWMSEQKAITKPQVQPLAEPKKFTPQAYTQETAVEPFSNQKLAAALKKDGDGAYTGDMTPEAAKELFALLGRRAAEAPSAAGSMKFWVKDGALAKYEFGVRGKITVGGEEKREVEISRSTTVELKNVGSTTVSLPEDAKKKL